MEPDAAEIRVLGCLVEKQRTTPDAYPLTLNSLRLACNQSTNRDPVLELEDATIRAALERLGRRRWTRLASWSGSRAVKYRHLLDEALGLSERELAVLCVLMLRGGQTPGELKQRSERLAAVGSTREVEETLAALISRDLVARLPRRPGQREERYEQRLGGEREAGPAALAPVAGAAAAGAPATTGGATATAAGAGATTGDLAATAAGAGPTTGDPASTAGDTGDRAATEGGAGPTGGHHAAEGDTGDRAATAAGSPPTGGHHAAEGGSPPTGGHHAAEGGSPPTGGHHAAEGGSPPTGGHHAATEGGSLAPFASRAAAERAGPASAPAGGDGDRSASRARGAAARDDEPAAPREADGAALAERVARLEGAVAALERELRALRGELGG